MQGDENAIHQNEQGIWDAFSVDDLVQRGMASQLEALQTVSINASKEYGLEKALAKMHADWDGLEFRVIEYKDTGTYIVGGTDEIQVICGHMRNMMVISLSNTTLSIACMFPQALH